MRKIKISGYLFLFSLLVFFLTAAGCKSDEPQASTEVAVSFSVNNVSSPSSVVSEKTGMSKAKASDAITTDDIICSDLKADYVKYKIDGGDFKTIPVFYVGGIPFTNSIKLGTGSHVLSEFLVYSDNNTPNDTSDDILLSATPHTGSTYASYVTSPLNYTFTITVDQKLAVTVQTVCFTPKNFDNFGFTYFKLGEINVKQLWFFADFCIKSKADYDGSQYAAQPGWTSNSGPFIDVPAIMKIEVWDNGFLQNTFSNSSQGEKLGVNYADYAGQADNYELKLFILVRQGTAFNYVYFKSWTFTDVSNIPDGGDGVIDGVLGNCYDPTTPPDFILAPWMNIPSQATYTITAFNPATLGAYVDATLSNIPTGYDIKNGVYASNCADHSTTINVGQAYAMDVYSSLYPDKLPLFVQSTKWDRINWLYNHLDWYPGYLWSDVQGFIWLYDNPVWDGSAESNVPAITTLTKKMKSDADLYGVGYKVPPGGYATIIFLPTGTLATATSPTIQTMFIKVDP
jgi:hypothetical protein